MPRLPKPPMGPRPLDTLVHADTRRNIPTAEFQSLAQQMEEGAPVAPARYKRASPLAEGETRPRNADLDPQLVWRGMRITLSEKQRAQLQETGEVELGDAQLVWRGKDTQDWSDLVVNPPPIYIQEKVHPKAIIEGLRKEARARAEATTDAPDLFADFNGLDDPEARLEFYQHDQHWSNRMILGDSLQVMASLAEREGLRGKVQCIYFDPPYGIKFNSNWQVSTQNRDVKDGKREDVSREPEQVKAFRDTWKDGVHSYLTYLRDRLTVAHDLLHESGSIFVQISDENVHRIRTLMDEIFGASNFVSLITYYTSGGRSAAQLPTTSNYLIWYSRDVERIKFRRLFREKAQGGLGSGEFSWVTFPGGFSRRLTREEHEDADKFPKQGVLCIPSDMTSSHEYIRDEINYQNGKFWPGNRYWSTSVTGIKRLERADRIIVQGKTLRYKRLLEDFPYREFDNIWSDTAARGFFDQKVYVVQTGTQVIQRCILMTTDPGDLVLDPTCGSGTAAYVAEQWGRRWITIDTSRVAVALARTRLMAARYPYYLLSDSRKGQHKEGELMRVPPASTSTGNDIRQGFVYEMASRVTMKSIANNAEIDVLWERAQISLELLRAQLNSTLGKNLEEWEIPSEALPDWPLEAKIAHTNWWRARLVRQKEIENSISAKAEAECLYDKPYSDNSRVRLTGPFTVESLSPHRVVPADEDDLLDMAPAVGKRRNNTAPPMDFVSMALDNLRTTGVHHPQRANSIHFTSLQPWPGNYIGAEGRFQEGETERRAGILIGPEFGTLSRTDLVTAAREASEARFDVLIACAFSYDAHATELTKLGPMPILKARMNPDLHMADDLKNTGKGNLFVVFGEPDLVVEPVPGEPDHLRIRILGVDVFDPQTGDIRSGDTKSIAAWFIDTDYNEESFYVRHAYFLGAQDPYKSLKAALRAEIDEEAWATLYRDVSRPFRRPEKGRIAVKVINHFGDEVMKVFTA